MWEYSVILDVDQDHEFEYYQQEELHILWENLKGETDERSLYRC